MDCIPAIHLASGMRHPRNSPACYALGRSSAFPVHWQGRQRLNSEQDLEDLGAAQRPVCTSRLPLLAAAQKIPHWRVVFAKLSGL